jgi:predicted nucleotidyltransferase
MLQNNSVNPVQCLREHMDELRKEYFVSRIGIFGSFARGEAQETSDVDNLVEFDRVVGLFHFVALQDRLSKIVERKVDLGEPEALKPIIKGKVLQEVIWYDTGCAVDFLEPLNVEARYPTVKDKIMQSLCEEKCE